MDDAADLFELAELTPGRWRVTNRLTGVSHVTYGTRGEVMAELLRQSGAWRARGAKMANVGWRRRVESR